MIEAGTPETASVKQTEKPEAVGTKAKGAGRKDREADGKPCRRENP